VNGRERLICPVHPLLTLRALRRVFNPAIHAAQDACENLFAMMDDELAKHAWFSGDTFGVGDIAVAPA
jgi:glutathione S-transferase